MNIEFLFFSFFISVISIFLIVGFLLFFKHKKQTNYIKNFPEYMTVLRYFMEKAYDIIHKDRILVYSLDGFNIKDEDLNKISSDFIKLVIKLIGPTLYKEFVNFYGDDETFLFNIIEFFTNKYEADEIRKHSLDELSSKDLDEEKND